MKVLVSDSHKFVFHHVPNTAGSSITSVLAKHCRGYKGQPEYFGGETNVGDYAWPSDLHCGYQMHEPIRNTKFPSNYFSFAFIRRPEDMDFITDDEGNTLVDFVGRYENLEEDFDVVLNWIGLEKKVLPKWNISSELKISTYTTKDFGYAVVDNIFSNNELSDIWKEIHNLNYIMDLDFVRDQRKNDAANTLTGDGLTVDNIYLERKYSAILTHSRKLFQDNVVKEFSESHPANLNYRMCNFDTTWINRYRNGQGYGAHTDSSSFSSITTLIDGEVMGGELTFPDYNIEFESKTNQCVIFPSWVLHKATPIKSKYGTRYSMANFSSHGTPGTKQ